MLNFVLSHIHIMITETIVFDYTWSCQKTMSLLLILSSQGYVLQVMFDK